MTTRPIKKARALYPGMVTLKSEVWPDDVARREDEARWAERAAPDDESVGHGWDMIAGGVDGDRLLPEHDPDAPWNVGVKRGSADPARLSYDIASLDGVQPDQRVQPEIKGLMSGALADGVTYVPWPVPGDGRPAKKDVVGPNGHKYSDGRYAPNGGTRFDENGNTKPHQGIDLPARIGTPVGAAADGVVTGIRTQWSKKNPKQKAGWGDYVDIRYRDGTIGKYAHLRPEGRPVVGAHLKRGEAVGIVGNTGNAATKGDHLHYEVQSPNGQTIDPTSWMQKRRIYVYRPD